MSDDVSFKYVGKFPDHVKLKKKLVVWPLAFCGSATWNNSTRDYALQLSCKDLYLKGKLSFQPASGTLQYRKAFGLPYVGKQAGCLVAVACWNFQSPLQRFLPTLGFELKFGDSATWVGPSSFGFKPSFRLDKRVRVQALTQLRLAVPRNLFTSGDTADVADHVAVRRPLLDVTIQEVNIIVKV